MILCSYNLAETSQHTPHRPILNATDGVKSTNYTFSVNFYAQSCTGKPLKLKTTFASLLGPGGKPVFSLKIMTSGWLSMMLEWKFFTPNMIDIASYSSLFWKWLHLLAMRAWEPKVISFSSPFFDKTWEITTPSWYMIHHRPSEVDSWGYNVLSRENFVTTSCSLQTHFYTPPSTSKVNPFAKGHGGDMSCNHQIWPKLGTDNSWEAPDMTSTVWL